MRIGADPGCEIYLPHPELAPVHAGLHIEAQTLWLEPAAAEDGHGLARRRDRGLDELEIVGDRILAEEVLDRVDADEVFDLVAVATRLTGRRADTAVVGDLRRAGRVGDVARHVPGAGGHLLYGGRDRIQPLILTRQIVHYGVGGLTHLAAGPFHLRHRTLDLPHQLA